MAAVLRAENPVIDLHEHYIKQTIRNRCTIITANGLMHLVIPVQQYRNHTPVVNIRIDHSTNWHRVHINAIRAAYGKSVSCGYYADKILPLYDWKAETLSEWNAACLSAVFSILKVSPLIANSSEYIENPGFDLRTAELPVEPSDPPKYTQVFMERHGFVSGLSILDLVFCEGPAAVAALKQF